MGRTEAERSRTLDELLACDCANRERQCCDKCQLLRPAVERLRAERDLLAAECQSRRDYTAGKCSESDMVAKWRAVDAAGCLTDGESGSS